jgi:iron complex outermembrane receptor protein
MLLLLALAAADAPPPERLPEIIVTARLRDEDAQSVPIALTAVPGSLLDSSYTVNTGQLTLLVPTLNYSSANPRNTSFTIRGLGSSVVAVSQANDGLEPGVGFYVDGVYHGRPATAAFDFSDIDQVTVLRGPQGTLFGKNTTAGAIVITPRLPSFDFEAGAEISYGSQNFVQARGHVSGPLIADRLALRLSALGTFRDGVLKNVITGKEQNNLANTAVRAQLLWTPGETMSWRLAGDWSNFDSNCCTQAYLRVGTSLRPAARQYPALAAGQNYRPPSTDVYDRLIDIDADLGVSTSEGGVGLTGSWDIGPATFTSITAWRFWNWDAANDRDYTGLPIQLVQRIPSRQDQWSQELRLASNGNTPLGYVIGLYWFNQIITGRPISIYGPTGAYWLLGPPTQFPANLLDGYGQDGSTRITTNSYASFGEANWRVTDTLTLTGGLRYTMEQKNGRYDTFVFGGLETFDPRLIAAKLSVLRPQSYTARDDDGSLSGRAALSWQATPQILAWVSAARSSKSGGINMSGLPLDAQNRPALGTAVIEPEQNTTYEIGIKSTLFDDRLIFNITGFTTTVTDFQATLVDNSQTVALRGYLSNIPKVTVKGFEIDSTALPAPGLALRFALAYADGRYADYPAGPCPLEVQTAATTACNLTGKPLAGLPLWSISLGTDYTRPLGPGEAFAQIDTAWRTGYPGDPTLSVFTFIEGYNLTNASIGWRSNAGWYAAVFARNLFAADYIQNLTIQAGNSGLILGTPSDPRVIGVTLGFRI